MCGQETKMMLQKICNACDEIEEVMGKPADLDMSVRDLFCSETHRYFMYLSASDGVVVQSECDYMNELFEAKLSIKGYEELMKDTDTYSVSFAEELPYSFKILALFEESRDDRLKELKLKYPHILDLAVDFYREAGIEFISCDRIIALKEIEDLGTSLAKKKYKLQQFAKNSVS